jgi:hypothetical protein
MIITFTGTREGMTGVQRSQVERALRAATRGAKTLIFRHGACHGADREFHQIVTLMFREGQVHAYPSNREQQLWARNRQRSIAVLHKLDEALHRNRAMVRGADLLIATPAQTTEQWRGSGTWATIRYARQGNVRGVIIYPEGQLHFTGR